MNFGRTAQKWLRAFCEDEEGQDMVEYSLLLAFIALAAVGLLNGVRIQIKGLWSTISSTLSSTNTAAS
jgi:Flp pilus assembly pilin Flp